MKLVVKKKPTAYIKLCQVMFLRMFAFASYVTLVDGTKVNNGRRHRRAQRESDSSPERIKKALCWVGVLLFIALAPVIFRFVHALITDPAIPIILNEGKVRGRRLVNERFGTAHELSLNKDNCNEDSKKKSK